MCLAAIQLVNEVDIKMLYVLCSLSGPARPVLSIPLDLRRCVTLQRFRRRKLMYGTTVVTLHSHASLSLSTCVANLSTTSSTSSCHAVSFPSHPYSPSCCSPATQNALVSVSNSHLHFSSHSQSLLDRRRHTFSGLPSVLLSLIHI